ncbi:FAD-dependent oxidoreductase [Bifidobacterium sp. ESL0732]|uniref:FAD-dependent oxidoreductase n=1 Tax=Bifidobacterium sp. ESL0732 TaxID=2983222 RepID=UPI0023F85F20|nr:FAD-dependent oxidoreductase [Bifidobacterium sp. ESL0732]WEV64061.1 FAD-dependent oxidoreductase [Bifidobacterium sp. ESL0732]
MKQQDDLFDVIVIGGGPAGLTAGLYLARARYRVLVLEKEDFGGQITILSEVVNYPGIASTDGRALAETMHQQAADFGAEFMSANATGVDIDGDIKIVHTDHGDLKTFGILLATGAVPRKVGFKGETEFAGHGISYCSTCDGEFFNGQEVIVVGGGFTAAEESVFLTKYATKVTVLVRGDDFTCDASISDEAKSNPKIEVRYNTTMKSVSADRGGLVSAVFTDRKTGKDVEWKPEGNPHFGVFVFAGYVPQTRLLEGLVDLDEEGYVITDQYLETSAAGVYAAGDLRRKTLRQLITAVSDGGIAAVELERYAKDVSEKLGLVPPRPTNSKYERHEQAYESNTEFKPQRKDSDVTKDVQTAGFFDSTIRQQLKVVFSVMAKPLMLEVALDETPLSPQVLGFVTELAELSGGKLTVRSSTPADDGVEVDEKGNVAYDIKENLPMVRPCVRVCRVGEDGEPVPTGIAFHGMPSGREFSSFVLSLYNVAGPGQVLDDDVQKRIDQLCADGGSIDIMVLVSLTCTVCPPTVLATQRIASSNPRVHAEAYEVSHCRDLQQYYGAMSVPCIVINKTEPDGTTSQKIKFGKKGVPGILDLIEEM